MERCEAGTEIWGRPSLRYGRQGDLFPSHGDDPVVVEARDAPGIGMLECYCRVRGAVVCMHTAAHLHGLLQGPPRTLWLGVPLRVYVPRHDPAGLQVIRWSNRQAFDVGVEEMPVPDGIVRRTTPERTIIDLVRYSRHAGGTTTAVRCLRAYIGAGGSETRIREIADALQVSRPAWVVLDALLLGVGDRP